MNALEKIAAGQAESKLQKIKIALGEIRMAVDQSKPEQTIQDLGSVINEVIEVQSVITALKTND